MLHIEKLCWHVFYSCQIDIYLHVDMWIMFSAYCFYWLITSECVKLSWQQVLVRCKEGFCMSVFAISCPSHHPRTPPACTPTPPQPPPSSPPLFRVSHRPPPVYSPASADLNLDKTGKPLSSPSAIRGPYGVESLWLTIGLDILRGY